MRNIYILFITLTLFIFQFLYPCSYNDLDLAFGEKVQKSKSGRYKDYARKGLIEDFIDKHDKMPDKIEMSELFEEKVNDKKYEKYKTISTKYLRKEKTPTRK